MTSNDQYYRDLVDDWYDSVVIEKDAKVEIVVEEEDEPEDTYHYVTVECKIHIIENLLKPDEAPPPFEPFEEN